MKGSRASSDGCPKAAIGYQLIKPLTFGAGYRLIYARNARGDFEIAHRAHLQAALSFKLKPLGAAELELYYRMDVPVGNDDPIRHMIGLRMRLDF
jgi:hypothetical protein